MKIAYITNAGYVGGWAHSVQIVNMCKAFASNNIDITLVLPRRSVYRDIDLFEYYSIPKTFKVKMLPCIDIFPGSSNSIFYWVRFISFYFFAKIYTLVNHFDFLYSRDLYSSLFFNKIILEQHSFPKKFNFLKSIIFTKKRKVIVLTSFLKKRFIDAGITEKNIVVAGSAVDLEEFLKERKKIDIKQISEQDFVFGYIGTLKTMNMEKGVYDCISALSFLPLNFKFLIVGGEINDIEYYKKVAEEKKVLDRCVFVGKVLHKDISSYVYICNVFVAPFPENEHYSYFMSPLKIFEYMASKKPIISTALPSITEVLKDGENAILIEPGNAVELATAIQKIKENPEIGIKLVENAYRDVSTNYTWKIRAENIIKFINS